MLDRVNEKTSFGPDRDAENIDIEVLRVIDGEFIDVEFIELSEKKENSPTLIKRRSRRKKLKEKYFKSSIVSVSAIMVLACILIMQQYPISERKAYNKFIEKSIDESTDSAIEFLQNRYDGKGLFGKLELKRKQDVYNMIAKDSNIKTATAYDAQKINDLIKVNEVGMSKSEEYSPNKNITAILTNDSKKNIKYIKVNIFYKNELGDIIARDVAEYNMPIEASSKKIISKSIPSDINLASMTIADVKFE